MIFAILFVIAFLIGLVVYWLSERWLVAVFVSMALFVITTLIDTQASDKWLITLVFGLPIVFFASLFGAYVVQLRRGEDIDPDDDAMEPDERAGGNKTSSSDSSANIDLQ